MVFATVILTSVLVAFLQRIFMNDTQTTLQELRSIAAQFVKDRNWQQFHDPKNLSMALSVEAAELMEKFLWYTNEASVQAVADNREAIEDELADVLAYVINFANATDIDLSQAFERKMAKNRQKYPVDKAKGRADKYNRL